MPDLKQEQKQETERSRIWGTFWLSLVVIAIVAITVIVLVPRLVERTFQIPVEVLLCGSEIELETLTPGDVPPGCVTIPVGIDLSMRNPDEDANLYDDGWFGFREVKEGSYDATLVVNGALDTSTIGVVTFTGDASQGTGQMIVSSPSDGEPEWTLEQPISTDVSRLLVVLVTSPESPAPVL